MASSQESTLLNSIAEDFYKKLEEDVNVKIPIVLRNFLLINDIYCAEVLARVDEKNVQRMELFMREEFTAAMTPEIPQKYSMKDFLGKYEFCQEKFKISSGHEIILNILINHCAKILSVVAPITTTISSSTELPKRNAIEHLNERENLRFEECFEQPREFDKLSFSRYIGSLIITIFNDAKRLSLSGWSWPSRHFAAEKSNHFKITGSSDCNPTRFLIQSYKAINPN